MTTPTRLDPRVFERAAGMIANREIRYACDAIWYACGYPDGIWKPKASMHTALFDELFKPPVNGSSSKYGLGWWDDGEVMPRAIALDLCALILRDEQRRARK
jgi:hypothetical protein